MCCNAADVPESVMPCPDAGPPNVLTERKMLAGLPLVVGPKAPFLQKTSAPGQVPRPYPSANPPRKNLPHSPSCPRFAYKEKPKRMECVRVHRLPDFAHSSLEIVKYEKWWKSQTPEAPTPPFLSLHVTPPCLPSLEAWRRRRIIET